MLIILKKNSIVLRDTNFSLEVYKSDKVTEIKSVLELNKDGYIVLDANRGDLLINWDSNDYPNAILHNKYKILKYDNEKQVCLKDGRKVFIIENLKIWTEKESEFYRIFVEDIKNKHSKAVFIYDGCLSLQHSSFKYGSANYWKMQYVVNTYLKEIIRG